MKKLLTTFLLLTATVFATDRAALIQEIKQTERDFCVLVVKDGGAVAFPAFMAEPAILGGQVMPTRAIAATRLPNRPRRPGVSLHWEPIEADVSASGDFGFAWGRSWVAGLTAPDGKPVEREGLTFTVWRKQADGSWKFLLDAGGAASAEAVPAVAAVVQSAKEHPAPGTVPAPAGPVDCAALRAELRARDLVFAQRGQKEALLALAAEHILSIDLLARGKPALAARLAAGADAVDYVREPLYSDVSPSGDLGYTLGLWKSNRPGGAGEQTGVYFSLWKRGPDGGWQIAVDNNYANPTGPNAINLTAFKAELAQLP